jgi:hypothetical protein
MNTTSFMELDSLNFPESKWDQGRMCDGCEVHFEDGDYAVTYFCDRVWMQGHEEQLPRVTPHELYCLHCYTDEVPLPHLGTNEGFCFVVIEQGSEEGSSSYSEKGIIRGSAAENGVNWDPAAILDEFNPPPIEALNVVVTPAYAFNIMYRLGIDLRGFVQDGGLVIAESEREHIKEIVSVTIQQRRDISFTPEDLGPNRQSGC